MVIDQKNPASALRPESREEIPEISIGPPGVNPIALFQERAPWTKGYERVKMLIACFVRMYGPTMKEACDRDLYDPLDERRLKESLAYFERVFPGDVIVGPGERTNLVRLYRAALCEIDDRLRAIPAVSQKTRFQFIVTVATLVDGIRRAAAHPER